MSRHLRAVPDPEPSRRASGDASGRAHAELLETLRRELRGLREAQQQPTPALGRCCPDGYACGTPGRPGCVIDAALARDRGGR